MNLRLLRRVHALFRSGPLDRRLDAELAAHIELATDDNIERGMTPAEARRAALVSLGGLQQARERNGRRVGLCQLRSCSRM